MSPSRPLIPATKATLPNVRDQDPHSDPVLMLLDHPFGLHQTQAVDYGRIGCTTNLLHLGLLQPRRGER